MSKITKMSGTVQISNAHHSLYKKDVPFGASYSLQLAMFVTTHLLYTVSAAAMLDLSSFSKCLCTESEASATEDCHLYRW
jgi:hypothetical protein